MLMNINVVDNILMQRHPVVDILKKYVPIIDTMFFSDCGVLV